MDVEQEKETAINHAKQDSEQTLPTNQNTNIENGCSIIIITNNENTGRLQQVTNKSEKNQNQQMSETFDHVQIESSSVVISKHGPKDESMNVDVVSEPGCSSLTEKLPASNSLLLNVVNDTVENPDKYNVESNTDIIIKKDKKLSDKMETLQNNSQITSADVGKSDKPIMCGALSQLLDYGMTDSEDSESDSVSISDTSDTNSDLSDEIVSKPQKIENSNRKETFRKNNDSSSDSSTFYDSDSSSDSGDVGACAITPVSNNKKPQKMNSTITKGELTLDDLPPIEQLQISVPEQECVQIGVVSSIVEQLVIVQSQPGLPAYDIDTLLFMDRGTKPLGRIFDVLGPVTEPFYAVRFNSYEQACAVGVKPGTPVYCAPYSSQHTAYVFVNELLKMKGSDASWKHNNEPPDQFLDYSDDEQEAAARRKRSGKPVDPSKSNSLERNRKFERQMNNKNILMNERFNQPSTSRRPEPERKGYQPIPNTPHNWSVPQAPRAVQRPEFYMPYQFGYFNQYNQFPVMPQLNVPMGPNVFAPQAFNPHVPPPIMRPQPVSYFPNPRHPRWAPPGNGMLQPPRGNFGNGGVNQ